MNLTIHELIKKTSLEYPNNIAAVYQDEQINYSDLDKKSDAIAKYLIINNINKEEVVGVFMEKSINSIIAILGILKAGGAYLPLNLEYPEERILYMLHDSKVRFVISDNVGLDKIPFSILTGIEDNKINIIKTNKRAQIINFNELPIPDRTYINFQNYKNKIGMGSNTNSIAVQGTRGCPFNCLYCHKIWPKKLVSRSAENIFNEINYFYKRGVKKFSFIDDIFNLNKKGSLELFDLILKGKLDINLFFPNGLRCDILDFNYIDKMIEAGTKVINLPLETASPRLQKLIQKNIKIDKFRSNVKYIADKYPHIGMELTTMHGFPTETEEEAYQTLEFMKSIKWFHFAFVHILKIYPNTEMEEFALQNGISKQDILRSQDKAFHELPDTLPFPKQFTKEYQSNFMNEYALNKERLKTVIPYQMQYISENALIQRYNGYLPIEINCLEDLLKLADIKESEIPDNFLRNDQEEEYCKNTIFNQKYYPVQVNNVNTKKILLLDLSQHFSSKKILYKVVEQPLGLLYLATYLKEKFKDKIEFRIYKSDNDFNSYNELKLLIEEFKPDLIGIRTLTYFKEFFHETVANIKQWYSSIPIITGGPYASSDYDTILKDSNIELVVLGEGEHTLSELIEKMLDNSFKIPSQNILKEIDGIIFRDSQINNHRKVLNIENFDFNDNVIPERLYSEPISTSNLAYVMYTSGTTGKPKGVMIEHKQVLNCLNWMQDKYMIKPKEIVVNRTELTFDPSVWEMFLPLVCGGTVKVLHSNEGRDAAYIIELLQSEHNCRLMYCPASMIKNMLYLLKSNNRSISLKMPYFVTGAEAISKKEINEFYKYLQGQITNTYGPTECTINNTYYDIAIDDKLEYVPIGKPVLNNRLYLLNDDLVPVPKNTEAEIYIAGDSVGRGYINNENKTTENFRFLSFETKPVYKTGDIGLLDDFGNIKFLGRKDKQVKINGYRIELDEIKNVLLEHTDIDEAIIQCKNPNEKSQEVFVCKNCGITNKYPKIIIEDGICNLCKNHEENKQIISKYFGNEKELIELLTQNNNDNKYHAILIFNGSKGSAYALYKLKELQFNILTITFNNGYLGKKRIKEIKTITDELGVYNVIIEMPEISKTLKYGIEKHNTFCTSCFYAVNVIVGQFAQINDIPIIIGATLSRGQIIENKLKTFIEQDITDVQFIEEQLEVIRKNIISSEEKLFDLLKINKDKYHSICNKVKQIDFFRYYNPTNLEIAQYLNEKNSIWKNRNDVSIYSTGCIIKKLGDSYFQRKNEYHFYGAATYWEYRLKHISMPNIKDDLECNIKDKALNNFLRKINSDEIFDYEFEGNEIHAHILSKKTDLRDIHVREYLTSKLPCKLPQKLDSLKVDKIVLILNCNYEKEEI